VSVNECFHDLFLTFRKSFCNDINPFQIINVYITKYDGGGQYWPIAHNATVCSLLFAQLIALGVFGLKRSTVSAGFIIPLLIVTILFHQYCRKRFLPVFRSYSAQVNLPFSLLLSFSFIHKFKLNSVCFRFLLTWIRKMNNVERWKRFTNNCVRPTNNPCHMSQALPNAPAQQRTRGLLGLQKISRKVCLHYIMVEVSIFRQCL